MSHILRKAQSSIIACCVLAGALLVGAPPAYAADSTVTVRADGAVRARGAAIVVVVNVTCSGSAEFPPSLSLRATQRLADGTLLRGSGHAPDVCTGSPTRVALTAQDFGTGEGLKPFRVGSVFVTATLQECGFETCETTAASRTVRLADVALGVPTYTSARFSLRLPSSASLEADGAGAIIRVTYSCPGDERVFLNLSLHQRTSARVTSAGTDGRHRCPGLNKTAVAAFHAEAFPWIRGPAYVILNGQACLDPDNQDCATAYAHRLLTVG